MIKVIKILWNESTFIRFIFIGATTVFIDFFFYLLLILLGLNTELCKGISFIIGTIFAYFANKTITFRRTNSSIVKLIIFIFLYLISMTVNVTLNEVLLNSLNFTILAYFIAFMFATFISSIINFLGMKFIIFYK